MTTQPTTARTGRRRGSGPRLLAALGLALAAAVLPATAVHASPQSPDVENQFPTPAATRHRPSRPTRRSGAPRTSPTRPRTPSLSPPDCPTTARTTWSTPPRSPSPPNPNPTGDPDPSGDAIPTPQRVDAGFGGATLGSHQAAGLALIAAAVVLALLVVVLARRHRAETGAPGDPTPPHRGPSGRPSGRPGGCGGSGVRSDC